MYLFEKKKTLFLTYFSQLEENDVQLRGIGTFDISVKRKKSYQNKKIFSFSEYPLSLIRLFLHR